MQCTVLLIFIHLCFVWQNDDATSNPSPRSTFASFYDESTNVLYIHGGASTSDSYLRKWNASSSITERWSIVQDVNLESNHAIVVSKNNTYVFGGNSAFLKICSASLCNVSISSPILNGARSAFVPNLNSIYIFGGQSSQTYPNTIRSYNIQNSSLVTLANTGPSGRTYHSLVYDEKRQRILVSGGKTGISFFSNMWAFNITSKTWSLLLSFPSNYALYGHSVVVVNDSFLVMGGTDTFGVIKNHVWKYDFTTSTWTSLGTLPSPRSHFTAFLHKPTGRLCIWGGKTTNGVYNGPVQCTSYLPVVTSGTQLTTSSVTTSSLTTGPITTGEITSSSQSVTTATVTTGAATTATVTTGAATTESTTSQSISTQEPTTNSMTTNEFTSQGEFTTSLITTSEITSQSISTGELTTSDLTTQSISTTGFISENATCPQYRCTDGSCVESPDSCLTCAFGHENNYFMCSNGTCVSSPLNCSSECSICWDGSCSECSLIPYCPNQLERCADGSCQPSCNVTSSCSNPCADGTCRLNCPLYYGCGVGEILCTSGECVTDISQCKCPKFEYPCENGTCSSECRKPYDSLIIFPINIEIKYDEDMDIPLILQDPSLNQIGRIFIPQYTFAPNTYLSIRSTSRIELLSINSETATVISPSITITSTKPFNGPVEISFRISASLFKENACLAYESSGYWICESDASLRNSNSSIEIYGTTPHFTSFAFLVDAKEDVIPERKEAVKWPIVLGAVISSLTLGVVITIIIYIVQRNRRNKMRASHRERINNLEFLDIDIY